MSTTAITPWRERRHVGIRTHDHGPCAGSTDHPAAPAEIAGGSPGVLRDWPAFTLAILERGAGREVRIVGPASPDRPAFVERYAVRLPAGGDGELRARLRAVVDARQARWCLGHGPLSSCPLHSAAD